MVHYTEEIENDLFEIGMYAWFEWDESHPGLLRWRCERHVICFRRIADGFEIVRILHDRMLEIITGQE